METHKLSCNCNCNEHERTNTYVQMELGIGEHVIVLPMYFMCRAELFILKDSAIVKLFSYVFGWVFRGAELARILTVISLVLHNQTGAQTEKLSE